MKTRRVILGAVLAAAALAGHVQSRPWRGQGGQPTHAWGGGQPARAWGGQRDAPQGGYGRGYPQAYPGRGYGGYPPARYGPTPGYAPNPYGPPTGGGWRQQGAWRQQEDFLRQGVRQGQIAPLGSVIQNLRRITPGRQLDSDLEYMGPRPVYRVRWMTANGRRVDYFVDATTGAILSGR
ncbi:MAG: PepSY domain-containing protein [Caulobacteraceae bacterium]